MTQYLSPGIYVEEVPSGIAPIAGVGTSTAGFIGVVNYAKVEAIEETLVGRILKQIIVLPGEPFAAGTPITEENVDVIIAALGENRVQVSGPLRPVKTHLLGMTLQESVSIEGEPLAVGTPVTDVNVDAVIAALGGSRVQVSGPLSPVKTHLLDMTLQEEVSADGETLPIDTPITEKNVKAIIQVVGEGAMVKVAPLIPVGQPQLCSNFGEFVTSFGGFAPEHELQQWLVHAVYGFFNNGGTLCWVTRAEEGKGETDAEKLAATNANLKAALNTFIPIDEIALVAIPGAIDKGVQEAIFSHCENAEDRFAIVDGQPLAPGTSLTREAIRGGVRDSKYAALYFPWLDVGEKDDEGKPKYFPPSGHIAGIFARVDASRGVHKAPANEVIRGALGVQRRVSKAQQGLLNPDGINIVRQFNGNITVWGARTLGANNGEWKYINVRRLFLFLRESIDEGTQWVVFEPNTPELWAKITRNVTAFLTNVWRDGALFGSSPPQAFYVKCDIETNPSDVRDLGQVITEIGVAVTKPAEFVIFRISQWAGAGG